MWWAACTKTLAQLMELTEQRLWSRAYEGESWKMRLMGTSRSSEVPSTEGK